MPQREGSDARLGELAMVLPSQLASSWNWRTRVDLAFSRPEFISDGDEA